MLAKFFHFNYRYILKPILFCFDPEQVHDFFTVVGESLGRSALTRWLTSLFFGYQHPSLEQSILGLKFTNPVGLAAGFDKDARLTAILPAVGFGFEEVGSITGEACQGNPRPRLWRLPKSQSLIVHYGLKNAGAEVLVQKLRDHRFAYPLGISIAKTNSPATVEVTAGIADYLKVYKIFLTAGVGDYFTINISCPNAYGGLPFTDLARLDLLLGEFAKIPKTKPLFIKMPPDLEEEKLAAIILLAEKYKIDGFVCTNLTKDGNGANLQLKEPRPTDKGGVSGKALAPLAEKQLRLIRQKTGNKFILIACGGIFSAEDAYRKIKAGASLVQLVTGLIFEGPQLIGEINRGLVKLLTQDGYQNISEAIGVDYKKEIGQV
ncbi:MAG: Dihydroorotate dehydrogenase 2 [Candidatus Woesebacteria bacterium GW2011_GWA1_39_21b]|uniref:Dihydroorotate dehydrogenase (quinone) n=2 Tax=Patescibacteria group TaxID=1783273 RepID=A0A1G2QH43_9BACT|nr:MAG: Dihydroorotate dehydrogenase 2 [Candidatus Woesebacteria bacterium GW2011_GWA1_39_21b]KKS77188.1 MAG: Dihydroorotate dehydrogenase 2 [Parcubacteria group bacterium GW2011_GWB1_42_9]KKS89762.1 MAG: Dihydroorotate dehydrogenase 2 [Parcubacteria group bacterium GW2011_GWC1_43_11b]OHA59332.1 MAG: dihydroorotate dehydrogenase (quinone) [Candidatus Vogelbacteria bacterium RIFOXYB1_FULL_42_16]